MDGSSAMERQQIEVELLQAMYPDQLQFSAPRSELKYTSTTGGVLVLRIPDTYPEKTLPDIISATDGTKMDMRSRMKSATDNMKMLEGEEVLDAVIQVFESTIIEHKTNDIEAETLRQKEDETQPRRYKTVIIWLHHLLNSNKRKLALHPTLGAASDKGLVSGITKPGYPGILVYSGPAELVNAHTAELRQQRWQAFQVRYEDDFDEDQAWAFKHGPGIAEVENMSDVVHGIVNEANREIFLKATGVK